MNKVNSIDEYIAECDESKQERLKELRKLIAESAPTAKEKISWQMPTFYLNGNLIHFASHKNHIGVYPAPETIEHFADRLKDYKTSKGAIQFPDKLPLPVELIRDIVKYRVECAIKE